MSLEIVPATMSLGMHVANNMCLEEVVEVKLSHDYTPHEVMEWCLVNSQEAYAAVDEKQSPLAISGLWVPTTLGISASPWLLTSPRIRKFPVWFVKHTKMLIEYWLHDRPHLYNYVHTDHTKALAWAKATGFTVHEAEPHGVWQHPFHKIEIRRD